MTADPNADPFQDLRDAEAKASPGPWTAGKTFNGRRYEGGERGYQSKVFADGELLFVFPAYEDRFSDAQFITLARNQLPALLADRDAQQSRAEKAEADLAKFREALRDVLSGGSLTKAWDILKEST